MLFIILLKWRVLGANLKVVSGNEARKKTPNRNGNVTKQRKMLLKEMKWKLKAKAFYSILKSDDNAIFITFGYKKKLTSAEII